MDNDKFLFHPDVKSIADIDNEFALATATKKAEILRQQAVNMDEFCPEVHSAEVVAEHKRYVESLQAKFELGYQKNPELKMFKEYADVLEAIIYDGVKNYHWFGRDVYACLASVYDDIKHQVDMYVELPQESSAEEFSTLGLAIDATFGQEPFHKIELIMAGIKRGELREISYYQDRNGQRMIKTGVPAVVIGADLKKLKQLMEDWLNENHREMFGSPWQGLILSSIDKQAELFIDFAQSQNQSQVVEAYARLRQVIAKVRIDQKELYQKFTNDPVYQSYDQVQAQIESDIRSVAKEMGCDLSVLLRQKNKESFINSQQKQIEMFLKKIAVQQKELAGDDLSAERVTEIQDKISHFKKRIKEIQELINK